MRCGSSRRGRPRRALIYGAGCLGSDRRTTDNRQKQWALAMIDLRSIEVFLVVSDTGSFTTAAKRLARTQSAISQAIRQLEDQLGVVLINRASRFLSLTPAGELFQRRARQLIEDATALASMVRERGQAKLSELRFGMVDSFAIAVGPELIRSMLGESLNLSLWSDLTPRLRNALVARSVDVVVANDSFDDEKALRCYELLKEPFVLILPKVPAWGSQDLDLAKLAMRHPIIHYHASSFLASQIDGQFRRLNVSVSRRVSVDSTDKLLAMVAAGIGWSSTTVLSLLRSPNHLDAIRVLPFPGEPFHRRLFMLSRRGELDELVKRLAGTARTVLAGPIMADVARLFPDLLNEVSVPKPHDLR
jgi:DNA-binding transcriptional LysR family regulator